MRINANTLGLEELPSPQLKRKLSIEERLLEAAETSRAEAEAEETIADVGRIIDTATALRGLAEVTNRIIETTPSEAELIERMAQVVVAGTSADPEDIAPATESYIGKKYASEGFMDKAQKMIDYVIELIAKSIKQMKIFYDQLTGFPQKKRELEKTLAELKKVRDAEIRKVELTQEAQEKWAATLQPLAFDGVIDTSPKAILKLLDGFRAPLEYVTGAYTQVAGKRHDLIHEGLRSFRDSGKPGRAADILKQLSTPAYAWPAIPGNGRAIDEDGIIVTVGPELSSGKHLRHTQLPKDGSAVAEDLRKNTVTLVGHDADKTLGVRGPVYQTPDDTVAIINAMVANMDIIGKFSAAKYAMGDTQHYMSEMLKQLTKNAPGDGDAEVAEAYRNEVDFFVKAVSACQVWSTNPLTQSVTLFKNIYSALQRIMYETHPD